MLVLHYPMLADDDDALDEDIDFLKELAELADKELRAARLGECDGTDFGDGNMNVFCAIRDADARAACAVLVAALDREGIDGCTIAFFEDAKEDADAEILYPKAFKGCRFNVVTGVHQVTEEKKAPPCCDSYDEALQAGFVREEGAKRWLADLERGTSGAAGYARMYGPQIHFCPFCGRAFST